MVELSELGTDIDSSWTFNNDGDLILTSEENNLVQSIQNRLSCPHDSLNLFYYEYGSKLWNFMGWKRTPETLQFIRNEIVETLKQEPRIIDYELNLSFTDTGLKVDLVLRYDEDSDLDLSLIINADDGVVIDDAG